MTVPHSPLRTPRSLVRPRVRSLHPYVPGEQPKLRGLTKLNTNENPYPPSPRVLAAVQAAVDQRLRLYPDPSADRLRAKLAKLHQCKPENIIVGNGSDELLALATRAFVEPQGAKRGLRNDSRTVIQYFTPSYSLYPVLAAIHGATQKPVPLNSDFSLAPIQELQRRKRCDLGAALTFLTTPNAPSGHAYTTTELESICRRLRGVVVLDEAYVDFARQNAMSLALRHPQVIVSRTFSKAYSLCFQRVGYFVGHPDLIAALHQIRDSYNVNGLGQIAAEATLADLAYYRRNFRIIITTREETRTRLTDLGFNVLPSQANFLLAKPPRFRARVWWEQLRARKILVRWFRAPPLQGYLRITIGTPAEMEKLISVARRILESKA